MIRLDSKHLVKISFGSLSREHDNDIIFHQKALSHFVTDNLSYPGQHKLQEHNQLQIDIFSFIPKQYSQVVDFLLKVLGLTIIELLIQLHHSLLLYHSFDYLIFR